MRIGLIASEFPPGPGGIGAHAYNLARQLVIHCHQVVVFTTTRPEYPFLEFDNGQSYKIIRASVRNIPIARVFLLMARIWKFRERFDWFVLSGLSSLAVFPLVRLISRAPVLCVVHGHEVVMSKGLVRILVKGALLRADHVVTVSEFAKRILESNGIIRPITTIPNGVTVPRGISIRTANANKLVLITVGSLTKRKGQQNVLAALPEIAKKYGLVEYHIVGVPVEHDSTQAMAYRLGVADRVRFHGVVNPERRDALLRQSDIFLMLSENLPDGDVEGFGIAVLEANCFGIPAIGSKNTGVEQAINQGLSGCLVDARNSAEISEAIGLILEQYSKFSHGAIEWARQHDWKEIGGRYLTLLDSGNRG